MNLSDILGVSLLIILGLIILCGIFAVIWTITIDQYCKYQLYKIKTNKIQWRCEEIFESKKARLNNKSNSYICNLSYRILPSELNKFVNIFGDNHWIPVFDKLEFKDENEFKQFVSKFITLEQINAYIDKENCILWYEP